MAPKDRSGLYLKMTAMAVSAIVWTLSFVWWASSLHYGAMAEIRANTTAVQKLTEAFASHVERDGHPGMEAKQAALTSKIDTKLEDIDRRQTEQATDLREIRRTLQGIAQKMR